MKTHPVQPHPTTSEPPQAEERAVHAVGFHYKPDGDLVFTTTDQTTGDEVSVDSDGEVHVESSTTSVLTDEVFHADGSSDVNTSIEERVTSAEMGDEGAVVETDTVDTHVSEHHNVDGQTSTEVREDERETLEVADTDGRTLSAEEWGSAVDGVAIEWGFAVQATDDGGDHADDGDWGSAHLADHPQGSQQQIALVADQDPFS